MVGRRVRNVVLLSLDILTCHREWYRVPRWNGRVPPCCSHPSLSRSIVTDNPSMTVTTDTIWHGASWLIDFYVIVIVIISFNTWQCRIAYGAHLQLEKTHHIIIVWTVWHWSLLKQMHVCKLSVTMCFTELFQSYCGLKRNYIFSFPYTVFYYFPLLHYCI